MVVKVGLGRGRLDRHQLGKAYPGIGDVLGEPVHAALGIAVQNEAKMVQCLLPCNGHPIARGKGIGPHVHECPYLIGKEFQELDPDK